MHCHCLLQMHLTTLEFPLLKTLFSRFPNRNIISLCVYILYACDLFAQSIVCIVNVLQSEPPQCQENPALKMTKGQLTMWCDILTVFAHICILHALLCKRLLWAHLLKQMKICIVKHFMNYSMTISNDSEKEKQMVQYTRSYEF